MQTAVKSMVEDEDHLHIRGENVNVLMPAFGSLGSPPHTWRKCGDLYFELTLTRITSTYVEKITSKPYFYVI